MTRIGELLISVGACSADGVKEALRCQRFFGARLGTHLLRIGAVAEEDLARALGTIHEVPSLSGAVSVNPEALDMLPRRLVEKHEAVPCDVTGKRLTVLMTDPGDLRSLDDLAFAAGRTVRPLVASQARIWSLMRDCYGIERGLPGLDLAALDLRPANEPTPTATPRRDHGGGDLMSEEVFASIYQRA
jgi:hypothetical protein